ncbi:MAG: hypothetical protein M9962_01015 [Oligoflexia bacterium]|nr:hypothetical protein [Oligoflexia bacterium]
MKKSELQQQAIALKRIPLVSQIYTKWYQVGERAFAFFSKREAKRIHKDLLQTVYLRRGAGRHEAVTAASDLDFFLVLSTVPSELEMEFLKNFWVKYHKWRILFPFWGEVLMGDHNELKNWLKTPTIRAYEARFSWKVLFGKDFIREWNISTLPDARDAFSEALKHYWDLLQPVLKLREEAFHQQLQEYQYGAIHLRNATKAAIDIMRMHATVFIKNKAELESLWAPGRLQFLQSLNLGKFEIKANEIENILLLKPPLFSAEPFSLFSKLVNHSIHLLDEIADYLQNRSEEMIDSDWTVNYNSIPEAKDPYSLSVRQLFAERMLLRHQNIIERCILSESTTHMYFPLSSSPSLADTETLLKDLRDVSFSFDRFSVAMPLTKKTFHELEKTSLLDTPFHSFYGHEEIYLSDSLNLETKTYVSPITRLPKQVILKSFAELSFVLRFQPVNLEHFLEKMVALVLGLRLANEHKEISTDFFETLKSYGQRYPKRVEHLKAKIAPYLKAQFEEEEKMWSLVFDLIGQYQNSVPERASCIKAQMETLRRKNRELPESKTLSTDIWINLTPFLRMEMNTMKDRFFEERPELRI